MSEDQEAMDTQDTPGALLQRGREAFLRSAWSEAYDALAPAGAEALPQPRRTTDRILKTFLIADVRGYTLFTQERGDEAAAKLAARFAAVAREGVEARGGSVIELVAGHCGRRPPMAVDASSGSTQ